MKAHGSELLLATTLFLSVACLPHARAASVISCNETGLRSAIADGGTITFACDGVIVLTNSILITNSIMLDGNGRSVIISGNGTNRLFTINRDASLTLRHLTLTRGSATNGGAILNDGGKLTVVEVLLATNRATGERFTRVAAEGGAIYSIGILNATNCVFEDNQADGTIIPVFVSEGPGNKGGAVFVDSGTGYFHNCRFTRNLAIGSLGHSDIGAYPGMAGMGGAIYNNGDLVSEGCVFEGNEAWGGDGGTGAPLTGAAGGRGGNARGGGICNFGTLTVNRTLFLRNGAFGAAGGIGRVGTSSFGRGGVGGGGGNGGMALGGAINNSAQVRVSLSSFVDNLANGGAAGISGDGGSQVGDGGTGAKGGAAFGGALLGSAGSLNMTNCTMTGNSVVAGLSSRGGNGGQNTLSAPVGGSGGAGGPGADALGAGLHIANSLAIVESCTIASNRVQAGAGEAGGGATCGRFNICGTNGLPGTNGIGAGQAVFSGAGSELNLINTILAGNRDMSLCSGPIADGGHNLSSDSSCPFTSVGSRNNIDPLLGPLARNGGRTLTMSPLPGSPAIDVGHDATTPSTDQRGVPRPQGPQVDIGAVEATFLSIEGLAGGQVRLRYAGIPGESYTLEGTPSFGEEWFTIETKAAALTGIVPYSDLSASTTRRMFRVKSP